jgi:hypothetical protein
MMISEQDGMVSEQDGMVSEQGGVVSEQGGGAGPLRTAGGGAGPAVRHWWLHTLTFSNVARALFWVR